MEPKDIAAVDPCYWAVLRKIQLGAGKFSLQDHEFQQEPMSGEARRYCYIKATQLGITEIEVLRTLHGMIHRRYPLGVLYLFPTAEDVLDFSKSRFNPLILANRETIGKYVKVGGKGTDTSSLKKIHDAFLFLRGARLTQTVGTGAEEKEASKLRGIPVDRVVFDEMDLMDEDVVAKAKGRMGHSRVKEEVYLSNPTLPDVGIDRVFQTSDQRHWHKRCSCGTWTSAELTFPECVKLRPDHTGYIGCSKCGKDVGPSANVLGEWVPAKPDNTAAMKGWRLSQLMSAYTDPAEILAEFNDPPQGNIGDVYRLRLGLPYVAAEDRLTVPTVMECCGRDVMPTSHPGPCAMGVDVGKIKHVVIGCRTGKDRYEVVKVIRLSGWTDLHDIARRFNVKSAVIDIRPYEDEARQFQRAETFRIFLCEYSESLIAEANFSDPTGIVKVNRTEAFDQTHRLIATKAITIPRNCAEVQEFAKQLCGTAKVLEVNKRSGTAIYRYRKMGDEHYRNALNYFVLAAARGRVANARTVSTRQTTTINEYNRI